MADGPLVLARALAARHPRAQLPCPACAASVVAENLEIHLAKQHAGATLDPPWRGRGGLGKWFDVALADVDGVLVARHVLGARRVALPCPIVVGALVAERVAPNAPTTPVRTGTYVALGDALVLGCTSDTNVKAHWRGWTQGAPRRRYDIRVARATLAALAYVLAARGALTLAGTSATH